MRKTPPSMETEYTVFFSLWSVSRFCLAKNAIFIIAENWSTRTEERTGFCCQNILPSGREKIDTSEWKCLNQWFPVSGGFSTNKRKRNEISLYFYAVGESIEMRFANKQEIDWPNEFPRPARRFQNFPVLLQPAWSRKKPECLWTA